MKELFEDNKLILMEAAVVERLRRRDDIQLDPHLVHAPLLYNATGRAALSEIYLEYLALAANANIPILLGTPTWRANQERVANANIQQTINVDAVHYLQALRKAHCEAHGFSPRNMKIGGIIGCKNDAYRPDLALSARAAEAFHHWQIQSLADGGVDYLMAVTLPNVDEALGIANAMEKTGIPYLISFVIGKNGKVLDGTPLDEAVRHIDSNTMQAPLAYFVNCSYPSFLHIDETNREMMQRLLGIQANASSLEHFELDEASCLQSEDVAQWGDLMLQLNHRYGVKVLGGCCGTDGEHLSYLIDHSA